MTEVYPTVVGGPVWHAWREALADGVPRRSARCRTSAATTGSRPPHDLTVRVHRLGPGLLNTWIRHDEQTRLAERIAQTERLGNLGWGEWDLVTGTDRLVRRAVPDLRTRPGRRADARARSPRRWPCRRTSRSAGRRAEAFGRGETIDLTYRIRINGAIKHLRAVIDAVRDVRRAGR